MPTQKNKIEQISSNLKNHPSKITANINCWERGGKKRNTKVKRGKWIYTFLQDKNQWKSLINDLLKKETINFSRVMGGSNVVS